MDRVFAVAAYPIAFAAAITAFAAMIAAGQSPALAAFVPVAAVGLAILGFERLFEARAEWRPGTAELTVDLAFLALVMVLLPRALAAMLVLLLAAPTHATSSTAWPHEWPLAAQVILMVLAVDFLRYWLHRACHRFGPLWKLHEVHHSPDRLHVANVGRFHPLEKTLHFTLDTAPFLLLGVAPEVLAGYFLVYSVNGLFQHSNLRLRHGWLNYVVGSAETHRWHHARDPKLAACNFGSTTAIWDLAFGTWKLPGEAAEVGIPDRRYPRGFAAQLAAPFRGMGGTLIAARLRLTRLAAGLRLARTVGNPMRVQRRLLARIVHENRATAFGRDHAFDRIGGYEDFARAVPVSDFEALRPYIDAEIGEGTRALTDERPGRYVRTSGTTGRPKDVPLTPRHLGALRRIHRESVAFQYDACPEAFEGAFLAFTSPAFEGALANGKPFGSASGIVAGDTPASVRERFVVPPAVLAIEDSRVKYLLALRLALARPDVTWLGAANATTLLALMKLYREHHAALVADVRDGTFFLADRVPTLLEEMRERLSADPHRAVELEAHGSRARIEDLWPRLKLVVTWTCASAGVAARALRDELSSRTRVMELGYIASEFRGTITIGRRAGCGLPTFDTHFFEFVERGPWDEKPGSVPILTLDRLRKGREYYVIVTTPSGLYRYFINDVVRVTGFLRATPLLRFVQKGKGVTNITGEKLTESQVLQAVRECMDAAGTAARFVMMLADEDGRRYRLYLEPCEGALDAKSLAAGIDARLAALNVEYRAKRESARLGALEVRILAVDTGEAYRDDCVRRGQREGQFKMVALDYRRTFPFDLDTRVVA